MNRYLAMSFLGLVVVLLTWPDTVTGDDIGLWSFESPAPAEMTLHGKASVADGVKGMSVALDGQSLFEVKDSTDLTGGESGFTFTVWVNPYTLDRGQQMIAAKNRYALNERQWGVMVDNDGRVRLYVFQGEWKTAEAKTPPKPGHWLLVGVVVNSDVAELWVNGTRAGQIALSRPIPATKAPLTFGGVNDDGRIRQTFHGALDEAKLVARPLSPQEMTAFYHPVAAKHEIPETAEPFALWDKSQPIPKAADIPVLEGVEFYVIKKWEPEVDGYKWLHGVGLAWHKDKLYASFGHNQGAENTATEQGRFRVSSDGGKTWSEVATIDAGLETDNLAVSHGVFLSQGGELWAFLGAFHGTRQQVHTRAYVLDAAGHTWQPKGVVVEGGFWPMTEPVKMENGNWIMPGICVGRGNPAAVAISHGDDLTRWDHVVVPKPDGLTMWGESAVLVNGSRVLNIARYGGRAHALAAVSEDFGRSWTTSAESNLPMAPSKPYAGVLSTGHRYLICTTTADSGSRRFPLTIALSQPGGDLFSRVFVIRHAEFPGGPGESNARAALAYPYAVEHDGRLYVGYSNSAGRGGNHNSAELAIIPVEKMTR